MRYILRYTTHLWGTWSLNQSHSSHVRFYLESGTNFGDGIIKDYDVIKCENNCTAFQIGFLLQNFSLISSAVDHMVQGVHSFKKLPKFGLTWLKLKYNYLFKVQLCFGNENHLKWGTFSGTQLILRYIFFRSIIV